MPEIRRILVALKPAFAQSRMPELAVKVASEIRAEVEALLAEDSALQMAADLPFAQEILTTGARRSASGVGPSGNQRAANPGAAIGR